MRKLAAFSTMVLLMCWSFGAAEPTAGEGKHPFVPREFPIEHTSVDELVSLSSGTPFAQAMFILSKFSDKFENKVIIDPLKHKGNIGVDIENMHWKVIKIIIDYARNSANVMVELFTHAVRIRSNIWDSQNRRLNR